MCAFFLFWGGGLPWEVSPSTRPAVGRLRAPSPPLPSSIYRSYFGNFLSELKAHSWDSVTAFPAGKPGISWRLLEPTGPRNLLLQERDPGLQGGNCGGTTSEAAPLLPPFTHPGVMPPPLRESHISACWIFPGVSASTDATRLGRRHLSWLRTQPTHHHIYPGAGGAPKPQASPTFLLGEGAQILLDPTQCLADECPQSSPRLL